MGNGFNKFTPKNKRLGTKFLSNLIGTAFAVTNIKQISVSVEQVVENEFQSDRVLDLSGWSCPWCIVKTKSWLRRMDPGEVLEVISTDPEVQENFPQILETSRDRVIRMEQHKEYYRLLIRRG